MLLAQIGNYLVPELNYLLDLGMLHAIVNCYQLNSARCLLCVCPVQHI